MAPKLILTDAFPNGIYGTDLSMNTLSGCGTLFKLTVVRYTKSPWLCDAT